MQLIAKGHCLFWDQAVMVENVSISAQSSLTVIFIALAKQELNKQANKHQKKKNPKNVLQWNFNLELWILRSLL